MNLFQPKQTIITDVQTMRRSVTLYELAGLYERLVVDFKELLSTSAGLREKIQWMENETRRVSEDRKYNEFCDREDFKRRLTLEVFKKYADSVNEGTDESCAHDILHLVNCILSEMDVRIDTEPRKSEISDIPAVTSV